jgi:hypothetical protein
MTQYKMQLLIITIRYELPKINASVSQFLFIFNVNYFIIFNTLCLLCFFMF